MNATESADGAPVATLVDRSAPSRRSHSPVRLGPVDRAYRLVTLLVALTMVVTLAAIVAILVATAWPALGRLGWGFFVGTTWNETTNVYGALPFIVGTLITTGLALLLSVPFSLAIAILMTEYLPAPLATAVGVVVDVAAGVPTIVFGAWALLVLAPWLATTGEPALAAVLRWLPPFNPDNSFNGTTGNDYLAASLILAAMVFPTIVAVTRNAFLAAPRDVREASLGLGATTWETATRVVLRWNRGAVLGAVILACGRALGEAIAISYVIGNGLTLPNSIFDQGSTISVHLLNNVRDTIPGTLPTGALYALGVILLGLSLLTSFVGRLLTQRLAGAAIAGGGR